MAKLSISDAARVAPGPVVYVIAARPDAPECKIGMTTHITRRLSALRTASPVPLRIMYTWRMGSVDDAAHFERALLRFFRSYRLKGEWFKLSPEKFLSLVLADYRDKQDSCHKTWLRLMAEANRIQRRAHRVLMLWHAEWQDEHRAPDMRKCFRADQLYRRICKRADKLYDQAWQSSDSMRASWFILLDLQI